MRLKINQIKNLPQSSKPMLMIQKTTQASKLLCVCVCVCVKSWQCPPKHFGIIFHILKTSTSKSKSKLMFWFVKSLFISWCPKILSKWQPSGGSGAVAAVTAPPSDSFSRLPQMTRVDTWRMCVWDLLLYFGCVFGRVPGLYHLLHLVDTNIIETEASPCRLNLTTTKL